MIYQPDILLLLLYKNPNNWPNLDFAQKTLSLSYKKKANRSISSLIHLAEGETLTVSHSHLSPHFPWCLLGNETINFICSSCSSNPPHAKRETAVIIFHQWYQGLTQLSKSRFHY